MNGIDQILEHYKLNTPDIREHLDTLTQLASGCQHITEFGFRYGASFCALLKGRPKKLITYDIALEKAATEIFNLIKEQTIIEFNEISTLETEIEPTDLLFIDTLHTYKQLKAELELHGNKANKYLVFHDTFTYRKTGEDGSVFGLFDAIQEFVANNPHWVIKFDHHNNNGLLCLERQ